MGPWKVKGSVSLKKRIELSYTIFFLFGNKKSRSLMFCLVDHRKLMTSAKIIDFLGEAEVFVCFFQECPFCSRLIQLGEEHF